MVEIRKTSENEVNKVIKLVWETFLDFEALNYNREGVEEFRRFLDNKKLIKTLEIYGAYLNEKLVGTIALHEEQHICMFFVKKSYQNRGIGKKLLKKVLETVEEPTINSSENAVSILESLGFSIFEEESTINGIKIIPMIYKENDKKIIKLKCREKELELGKRTLIMGILNVTPDSFSDGGKYNSVEEAVKRAKKMIDEGADIIDIGGESTRPEHIQISIDEEINRVVPVIKELKKLDILLSIDTYKYEVAKVALENGVHIVNDIWGLQYDEGEMAKLVKKYDVPVIVMHNQNGTEYNSDIIKDMKEFFYRSFSVAKKYGIKRENIILDPGIGFGKTFEHNIEVMRRLSELRSMGKILLGTSRKRFLGKILGDVAPEERLEGTLATTVIGIEAGVDIVRVHDVLENKKISMVADTIIRSR